MGKYVVNESGALEWDDEGATSVEEIEHPGPEQSDTPVSDDDEPKPKPKAKK